VIVFGENNPAIPISLTILDLGSSATCQIYRSIPLSTDHLEHLLREHIAYYNHERNHQGLDEHPIPVPVHDRQTANRSPKQETDWDKQIGTGIDWKRP